MAIELGCPVSEFNLGYYQFVEKDYDLMKKYYFMTIKYPQSMHNLGIYYYVEKNYELMKKCYFMAIELGCTDSICDLLDYYSEVNDLSFIKLSVENSIQESFVPLLNEKFLFNLDLPLELHSYFCQFKGVNKIVKMKQYILKKTGIFPKKYSDKYDVEFMELISMCSCEKYIFSQDILLLIAGYLYV